MYEYNSEKILQRQKICMKCKSFVTHEKVDEDHFTCPLCGHALEKMSKISGPMPIDTAKKYVEKFYQRMKDKYGDKIDPNNQHEEDDDFL